MTPPATYKQIDLLTTARNRFRFVSNKLDYVAQALGVGKKHKHAGHELWVRCMAGEADAWIEMEEYNKNDVVLLEKVYEVFRPWIRNHPNAGLYGDAEVDVCPVCGDDNLTKRGFAYTAAAKYQRYRCSTCGHWCRDRKAIKTEINKVSDRG